MTCTTEVVSDTTARRVVDALDQLLGSDIESMNRADLDAVVAARRELVAFCDAVEIRIARRSRHLAAEGRSEPAADVLRERGRRASRDAAAAAQREEACAAMPSFETALADGSISTGHLNALANATAQLDEATAAEFVKHERELLHDAKTCTPEVFDRHARDLARTIAADDGSARLERQRQANNIRAWVDKITGMGHLHAELDPESHAKVVAALRERTRTLRNQQHQPGDPVHASGDPADPNLTYAQLEAQAFIELITGATTLDRRSPEVIVLVDLDSLVRGLHDESLCETIDGIPVPPSTVRRLCCEAAIIPAVLNGDGEPLDVGRASRLATAAQRRAIYTMYRSCAFPGCHVGVDRCEMHHAHDWLANGGTDIDNLVPLCCKHHHLVHEGGWTLTLGEHRVVTVHRPDGTHFFTGTTINRRPTTRAG